MLLTVDDAAAMNSVVYTGYITTYIHTTVQYAMTVRKKRSLGRCVIICSASLPLAHKSTYLQTTDSTDLHPSIFLYVYAVASTS